MESDTPQWSDGEAWEVSSEPAYVFGGACDASGVTVGRLLNAFRLSSGLVVIGDEQASTLYWVDPDRGVIASAGRPGEGPGEFDDLTAAFLSGGDTIVALDRTLRRVTTFGPGGEFLGTEPLERGLWETWSRDTNRAIASTFAGVLEDQTVVGTTYTRFSGPAEGRIQDSVWIVLDPPGEGSARLLGPIPGGEFWRIPGRIQALPLGRNLMTAMSGSHVYLGNGRPAEIRVVSADGRLVQVMRIDRPPREVDQDLVEQTKRRLIDRVVSFQRERVAGIVEEIQFPTEVAEFSDVIVDSHGNAWATRFRVVEGPPTHDVFSARGVWLGEVTTPQGVEILQIGEDFVLGTRRDTLDVDEVLLFDLVR